MQRLSLKSIGSTQSYLKELVKSNKVKLPLAVTAQIQTEGVGSRDNSWTSTKGNLFLSFAIELKDLPPDMKLESASIYFAYLLKDLLSELDSNVWLKWPNDFYLEDKKIGGMITNLVGNILICGVGLNLKSNPKEFAKLDIELDVEDLLDRYFTKIQKKILWKQVFSKYELEFDRNKNFFTHHKNLKISLGDVKLLEDGSIMSNGERIYSLR